MNEVLQTTYATWDKDSERLRVPRDPRQWTREHVGHWLSWAIREFSLAGPNSAQFVRQFQVRRYKSFFFQGKWFFLNYICYFFETISGAEMCALSKEEFLARAPPFMGDILWAHLEILQKEGNATAAAAAAAAAQISGEGNANAAAESFNDAGSNYGHPDSSSTFAAAQSNNNNNRIYTQLESSSSNPVKTSISSSSAVAAAATSAADAVYTNSAMRGGMSYDYAGSTGPGSTVGDGGSEYSYSGQQQQQQLVPGGGRVPQYPPPPPPPALTPGYPGAADQFGVDQWGCPPPPPLAPYPTSSAGVPSSSMDSVSVSSSSISSSWHQPPPTAADFHHSVMHQHPAFLQVKTITRNKNIFSPPFLWESKHSGGKESQKKFLSPASVRGKGRGEHWRNYAQSEAIRRGERRRRRRGEEEGL